MKFLLLKKRALAKGLAALLILSASVMAVALTGAAGVHAERTTRKLPIYAVQTEEKKVALSFDASWGADKTDSILAMMAEHDIRATFFSVGMWAEKYPDKLKSLSDSGRFEIGTHSNTHPNMPKLSKEKMTLELTASVKTIEAITGKKVELFRAPFGDYSDRLLETAEALGLYTVQWDVDSLDWKNLSSAEIAARILKKTQPGSIILMHNDGKHTVEALPAIIEGLKNKGYSFVPIGELIYRGNFTIDHTGRQIQMG
ncbi:MAG: polysaccharide deacetylase family protein [Clostridiales bacterium]|nr:polysaccharide deacetylase family protein [Clostridiales bacterium]